MTYQISDDAINDLNEIAHYTLEKWGVDEVKNYVSKLMEKLEAIGKGEVIKEESFDLFPDLYVTRFRYHLIYYLYEVGKPPQIARILHYKQDRVRHLTDTFSS